MQLKYIKSIDHLLQLRKAELSGEYWIDDSGSAFYADGDIGDYNHEMIVMERLISEILNCFNLDMEDQPSLDISKHFFRIKETLKNPEDIIAFEDDPYDFIERYIKEKGLEPADEIMDVFTNYNTDPREFALKNWGWIRIQGNNIQTMYLTSQQLQNISRGLEDIVFDFDDEESEKETFNIEVYSTHSMYEDVPISIIDSGDPSKLMEYREV